MHSGKEEEKEATMKEKRKQREGKEKETFVLINM